VRILYTRRKGARRSEESLASLLSRFLIRCALGWMVFRRSGLRRRLLTSGTGWPACFCPLRVCAQAFFTLDAALTPSFSRHWSLGVLKAHDLPQKIISLYISNDADLVTVLNFALSVTTIATHRASSTSRFLNLLDLPPVKEALAACHPDVLFILFLTSVGYDSTVLLDFLMSSETQFLAYFLGHLKLIEAGWEAFCDRCEGLSAATDALDVADGAPTLDQVMACLIRLRLSLTSLWAKNIFPYNPAPLVRRLEKLETLYDGGI